MAKRKKKPDRIPLEAPPAPFHRPFAHLADDLGAQLDPSASEPETPTPSRAITTGSDLPVWTIRKIVLQIERKGHGGKTMTRVKNLGLENQGLTMLAKQIRQALGCGALVDDEDILLQGDQKARLQPWLIGQGAQNIVVGN